MRPRPRLAALVAAAGVLLAACGSGAGGDDPAATPRPGQTSPGGSGTPAPEVTAEAFDGSEVSLADYRGTPVVLNFWASWCPPCIAEMPDFESVHQAVGGQVAFVGVNTQDRREDAADMVEQTGVTYDLLRDPEGRLFEKFGVFGMPTTFFINAAGEIVERHTGALTLETIAGRVEEHLGVSVDVAA